MKECELVEALQLLLEVPSVSCPGDPACAEVLEKALKLCRGWGFRVKNCGGQVGWAEIGQGSEMIGVLCHLDVVPAGDGWSKEPFACTVENGRVYGRGTADDKGPAVAAMAAMREILDSGIPLQRRIRIIFGTQEETGVWSDMELYKAAEELPVCGFTPDADFPALYGEKGILHLCLRLSGEGLRELHGGSAVNMVPDACAAVTVAGETLTARGRSAHGSLPHEGENAISKLMALLAEREPACPAARFYQEMIGQDLTGAGLHCAVEDAQSGGLTLNVGTVALVNGTVELKLDLRCPVSVSMDEVTRRVTEACAPWNVSVTVLDRQEPAWADRDGALIQTLMGVYRAHTGDQTPPQVIGGGTYARAMANIVAFGPHFPGTPNTEHAPDESVSLADLRCASEIYRDALTALANSDRTV